MNVSSFRERLRQWRALREITRDMGRQPNPPAMRSRGPVERLLVLPPDPVTLIGARGDQAMLQGLVDELREDNPRLGVIVATGSEEADAAARHMGYRPLRLPPIRSPMNWLVDQAKALHVDGAVLLGADMMDGYYSPVFTARSLGMVDALARQGIRTAVIGFSFNERPSPALKDVYDALSSQTHLHVRDPVSHRRLQAFTRKSSTLVADAAFLLKPDDRSPQVAAVHRWTRSQRQAGHLVLGYNVHPALVKASGEQAVQRLVDRSVEAMVTASRKHGIRWVLVPHDYRARRSDDLCLNPISEGLGAAGVPCCHPDAPLSAAEIKAIVGSLDAVVTGRMHLAIATLGQSVPVACIRYQGKFEGLLNHFALPPDLMRSPDEALNEGELESMIEWLVGHLPATRDSIASALPSVLKAARLNLAPLLEPARLHRAPLAA